MLKTTKVSWFHLVRSVSGATSFQARLPATQLYMIEAVSSGAASNYNLQVIIPRDIVFQPGGTSATFDGTFDANGGSDHYLIRALAGQTMSVTITSPTNDVRLTLYGIDDGQPLARANNGVTEWSGQLTLTQDYWISVVSNHAGPYNLMVTVQ